MMAPPAGGPGTEPTVAESSTALPSSFEISSSPLRSEPVLTATPVRRSVPLAAGLSLDPNPDIEWDLGLPTWVTLPG